MGDPGFGYASAPVSETTQSLYLRVCRSHSHSNCSKQTAYHHRTPTLSSLFLPGFTISKIQIISYYLILARPTDLPRQLRTKQLRPGLVIYAPRRGLLEQLGAF